MRITLNNVEFTRENIAILKDVSCALQTGMTYLIGKNGAGKSTLLQVMATALRPSQGTITYTQLIRDEKMGVYRKQLHIEEIRKIIGFMPQHFTGHSEMSIERYLTYMAFHKGIPHHLVKSLVHNWLKDANLLGMKRRKLKTLSGGQRQKVGLVQALINQPRICILDEPFESLDMQEKLFFHRVIQRLSFHSIIIISTHLIEEIERSEDVNVLYMEEGKLRVYGGGEALDRMLRDLT